MKFSHEFLQKVFVASLLGFGLSGWPGEPQSEPTVSSVRTDQKLIAIKGGKIGNLLRKWYLEGTAAGNIGDYYDNRDGGHSRLNRTPYPQLQQIEYTKEQIKARQNWGVQQRILPHVVFGNSSTSSPPARGGSNPRYYYTSARGLSFLFAEYARNNLYIYPEHRDHDPGHNGIGGYGDLFPTNTPYLIISQGSSGSDQPFMKALPYVLAAFRPEVKNKLTHSGLLMPTIQMLLRVTNRRLVNSKEYLTGKAHPTVFRGRDLNVLKMVEMAHQITLSKLPPIAIIKAVREDTAGEGVHYFEPGLTEKLADTPAVIARVFRGMNYLRKITVSGEESADLNHRPLKFFWVVLRGNPSRIKIEYLNASHSVAEITVPFQERFPITGNPTLESNRIDIGVFVHNGVYYSPPAFITFYTLDSEARTYAKNGRLIDIGYGVSTSTISIADWNRLFQTLENDSESWPSQFLRRQFKAEEISALTTVAGEYRKSHALLLNAREEYEKAKARQKSAGNKDHAELIAARKRLKNAEKTEKQVLGKKLSKLKLGAAELIERVMNSLLQDPNFWPAHKDTLMRLRESAGKEAQDALNQIQKSLILFDVAENSDGSSFNLKPGRTGEAPLAERPTRYEKGMIEHLNAVLLSRIVFPGIVAADRRANYVDARLTSEKKWRDVYRYAPDGTLMGWDRYQAEGMKQFNPRGLLVLERDSQGRCIRARAVRYEKETQSRNSKNRHVAPFTNKVRMVSTDEIREYAYEGANDWKGHTIKK